MYLLVLNSTSLAQVGYDVATAVLRVAFRDGSAYRYFGVPVGIVETLQAAPSKGSYFNQAIRGAFPCQPEWHED